MGASDLLGSGGLDLDNARLERSTRTNQPDYAPGQGIDDIFSRSLDSGAQPSNIDFSSAFQPSSLNMLGIGQPPKPVEPTKTQEDKIFEAIKDLCISIFKSAKNIVKSFEGTNAKFWANWGSLCTKVSLSSSVFGLVLMLLGLKEFGFNFMIGGMLSLSVGVIVLMFNVENARGFVEPVEDLPELVTDSSIFDLPMSSQSDSFSDELDYSSDDDDEFDYDDESLGLFDSVFKEPIAGMDFDTALDTIPEINKGMYTRSYLYEAFSKVLDSITPSFDSVKSFDEDSDTFITWEQYLRDSAEIVGTRLEDLPELLSLEETPLTIKLTCSRPRNFKYDAVAMELANIYASAKGKKNPKVYAISDTVGKECKFTVFTGETVMVSLKDTYSQCESFVLSTKNYIPIVIGTDEEGHPVYADFKQIESILVTGMPRRGKSWVVQLILTQMGVFLSPKELHFYICDPKDDISDFKAFTLPHVKKFVSGDDNIVNTLRKLIKEEAPRRKKLIGKAGFVNIWDYKDAYPDVELPIIYIVIDEVVTLAERMDKETKSEFQGYLVELISQLPALGIRAFLIPHVVKNDIIAKTATDLIPCRISVCGDAAHIEACTGTKPRDFSFKLSNKGDMAVRIPDISPATLFIHGAVLSATNPKNNKIFDYLRRLWIKLEPDCVAEPVHILAKNDSDLKELCDAFEVDEEDMLGFDDLDIL